jgi:hypothetical protein
VAAAQRPRRFGRRRHRPASHAAVRRSTRRPPGRRLRADLVLIVDAEVVKRGLESGRQRHVGQHLGAPLARRDALRRPHGQPGTGIDPDRLAQNPVKVGPRTGRRSAGRPTITGTALMAALPLAGHGGRGVRVADPRDRRAVPIRGALPEQPDRGRPGGVRPAKQDHDAPVWGSKLYP